MDLLNTTFPRIRIESLDSRVSETLSKLAQAGLFRALVIQTKGNQVLLDTAFGQIKGTVQHPLTKGDEIYARLLPGKEIPAIKIEQLHTARLELPTKILNQLLHITSQRNPENPLRAQLIKVLSQSPAQTLIRYAGKTYALPAQSQLQTGDTLLLKPVPGNKPEVLRIQPENVLRNALSRLLPLSSSAHEPNPLLKLQQRIETLPDLKPADIIQLAATPKKAQPLAVQNETAKTELTPAKLLPLLLSLSRPLGKLTDLNADTLRHILSLYTLVKPARTNPAASSPSLPELLIRVQVGLNSSPKNFIQLLQQMVEANSSATTQKLPDSVFREAANYLKVDIQQQIEQTLNQLHVQKTTLRLQQEQQLPIQINLNLPIQENDKTANLKLNIKQHKNSSPEDEQLWEINLSFEFSKLGLISTRLQLQANLVSVHFWASKSSTKLLIESHMDQFKQQLKNSGFRLGQFECLMGKPQNSETSLPVLSDNLVDIKV